jgi:small basic protein
MNKYSKSEILSYIGIFTLAIAYIIGIVFFSVPDKKEEKIFEIWQNKDLTFDVIYMGDTLGTHINKCELDSIMGYELQLD